MIGLMKTKEKTASSPPMRKDDGPSVLKVTLGVTLVILLYLLVGLGIVGAERLVTLVL